MTDTEWIGILAGALTVINSIWALVMRGVRAEIKTFRAEVNTQFVGVTAKLDLHVIDRLDRVEGEIKSLRHRQHELANEVQRAIGGVELAEQRLDQFERGRG